MGSSISASRLTSVHLLMGQRIDKLLWVFESGDIEYCTLQHSTKPISTQKYEVQKQGRKSRYSGRRLLEEITQESRVVCSALDQGRQILVLVV